MKENEFSRVKKRGWLASVLVLSGLASFLLLQACAPAKLSPQQTCNFVMSTNQQRVSWSQETPVLVYVDLTFPNSMYGAIESAAKKWNEKLGREVIRIMGRTGTYPKEGQDGTSVVYWVEKNWPDPHDKEAITTIYWSGDKIFEADMRINATSDFSYSWGDAPASGKVDVESLLLHEFGHVLGLSHKDKVPSVMATRLEAAKIRRDPTNSDLADLHCEY